MQHKIIQENHYKCRLEELHFYNLQSQSNVYGLTVIEFPDCKGNTTNSKSKLLVSTLSGKISAFNFSDNQPQSQDVQFHYIPHDAEIISLDAFYSCLYGGVAIGITFFKRETSCCFLNVYSDCENTGDLDLNSIAQSCLHFELKKFIPYQLFHGKISNNLQNQTAFLLSGSDEQIHMFHENGENSFQQTSIEQTYEFFPEFQNLKSVVIWCDMKELTSERITAIGCKNGNISVFIVNKTTSSIIKTLEYGSNSPITCIKIFQTSNLVDCPEFIKEALGEEENEELILKQKNGNEDTFHLVASSGIDPVIVFRDFMVNGFNAPLKLPNSNKYDSVLSVTITDIDFDGKNEIIIGTYGQQVLAYKFFYSSPKSHGEYKLIWMRSFANPILNVSLFDITNDGMLELIVLTLKGISVMQHHLPTVANLVAKRLADIFHINQHQDPFEELLEETFSGSGDEDR